MKKTEITLNPIQFRRLEKAIKKEVLKPRYRKVEKGTENTSKR